MLIGKFTKTETNGLSGTIRTLTLNLEVAFEPIAEKTGDKMPDYRVTAAGNADLSVSLDDPSLPEPIACAMVKTGAEHGYSLVWERRRKPKPKARGNSSEF